MIRFPRVALGDQLEHRPTGMGKGSGPFAFMIVAIWHDPIRADRESRRSAGEQIAVQRIGPDGIPWGPLYGPHTRRGLASNGYYPTSIDHVALGMARAELVASGKAVGIFESHLYRQRRVAEFYRTNDPTPRGRA